MRVVLEFNEAFNRHDVAGMMQLMSEDCVFENTSPAPDGTVYTGSRHPVLAGLLPRVAPGAYRDRGGFWLG